MTLVVDASVAVKWVLPEPDSEKAATLRARNEELIAPSLVHAEIGSALWRATLRGDMSIAEARTLLRLATAHFRRMIPLEELAERAIELAAQLRHPIYDCFYLALAEHERCALVTFDRRLVAAAKHLKGLELRKL
jgi:predicted nucleic acid-binding protein